MSDTVGVILAGGHGSRLFPLTRGISKQLLPVYDKPMIYYPLSTLMELGIKKILIISTPRDLPRFKELLGKGSKLGLELFFKVQRKPKGIAEAFVIASNFISKSNVCLILGDNIFHSNTKDIFNVAQNNLKNNFSTVFAVDVQNPKDFGVIEFDKNRQIKKIIEKPRKPKSNSIISGLYFYTNDVKNIVKELTPSERGELEITDINNYYLNKKRLKCVCLDKNTFWSDTGTYDSLFEAAKYFQEFENMTGHKIACIELIALKKGFISKKQFKKNIIDVSSSKYGEYLKKICCEIL
tara:strand:- start:88 stop:972 length:885 start_codon:yes stop_codon:yes gene_type:complete